MSKIQAVRNRQGHEEPFDEDRIVRSILRASSEVGGGDAVVARELAGVVTLFLERRHWDSVPHVDDIQDMVERVLLETGHVEAARAYIRSRSSGRAAPPPAPRTASLFPETTLSVTPGSGSGVSQWDRSRIETALEREAGLPPEQAASVAETVERRILNAGIERISSRLIRSLVDAELFGLGLVDRIHAQAVVGVPGYDLKRWIEDAAEPVEVTRRVAERAFLEFSFSDVFSREVAAAHSAGRIHIVGAASPMHLHSIFLTLEFVKRFGDAPGSPETTAVPEDLAGLGEALRTVAGDLASFVHTDVDIGYLNLMAAPLLGGDDPYAWAGSLLASLDVPGVSIPAAGASVEITGGVPDFLRFTDAVGPGGIRLGRGYGEFWTDAERLTRALVDAFGRAGAARGPALHFHVDANTFRNPSSLSLLRGLCAEVARGLPLTFVFERKGSELRVHSRFLTRVEDPGFFRHPESTRIPYLQMVAINAAQAAFRAGRGNFRGFTDEIEGALKSAFLAHEEKGRFLSRLGNEFGGPLSRLTAPAPDGKPTVDLARGEYLLAVCGFPEAIGFLSGEEADAPRTALKLATQAASFLTLRTREEARKRGLRVALTGPCPEQAARQLFEIDRASFPAAGAVAPTGYRTGLVLREDSPHDLLQAVRVVGSLFSLIEPSVTIAGVRQVMEADSEGLFDLLCEVFERTEMTYLRFQEGDGET